MSRPRLYSIAPHGLFLETLTARVLDGTLLGGWDRSGPFWLSDVTIILPTRRARLTLAEMFARQLGGAALLPDIRTFGGESEEEEPFLPPADAPPLPAVASDLERRLTLSRLVEIFARADQGFASPPNAAEIFRLAESLGALADDFTIEGVGPSALRELVPEELAGNWQEILRFLEIALAAWPKVLKERGKIDAAAARNARLRRQAATATALYGERPVIAAGSTGSIPATAELLGAIARLPRGALVLPGLDTSLTAEQHEALLKGQTSEGHPQFNLARLLGALGAGIAEVEELAGEAPRTALVRLALRSAEETSGWVAARGGIDARAALAGISVLAAHNADLEARAIALAARDAIGKGRSVGIVSRDQTLARRIVAELSRHGLEVDDPAGTPLYHSAAGRLARQVLAVVGGGYSPIDTIALLHNGTVTLGMERREVAWLTERLDLGLRGERISPGLAGLLAHAGTYEVKALLEKLGEALVPLQALLEGKSIDAVSLATTLLGAIEALIDDGPLPGLMELTRWAEELAASPDAGAPFAPMGLDEVLAALMAGATVQSGARRRDDLFVWGELEARLMNPDLLVLAGLNEDIWPPAADPGPWLSRGMRIGVGLAPPERRQGQAAHDFEMALGNAELILAFAERIGTAPALPSRLLQRLEAFAGDNAAKAMRARGAVWLNQAAAIDFAGDPRPAKRPMPKPPAALRPRQLSVTEIETLMRSPYDIYARHTLRLRKLEPLGIDAGARERGTMIHEVFERFVREGHNFSAEDALARMMQMAQEAFHGLETIGERRDIWLRRFETAAEQFLDWERARHGGIASRAAEIRGAWDFSPLQNFVLVGKADRIDRRTDGLLEILDFKTGGVPTPKEMTSFEAPQLLLEAAMAVRGAFPDVPAAEAAALTYIKIGLGPAAFQVRPFSIAKGTELRDAVDNIARRTQGHIETFLIRDHLPMHARIRPRLNSGRKPRPGDYDHLARTDEWTLTAGVDDP